MYVIQVIDIITVVDIEIVYKDIVCIVNSCTYSGLKLNIRNQACSLPFRETACVVTIAVRRAVDALADYLRLCRTVKELCLSNMGLDDHAGIKIAASLSANSRLPLTRIDLSKNRSDLNLHFPHYRYNSLQTQT